MMSSWAAGFMGGACCRALGFVPVDSGRARAIASVEIQRRFSTMPQRLPIFTIRSKAQLAAISSPVRQEILDGVQALGPGSIAEVAKLLGRPADSLYYHVRTLERLGLLVRTGERRNGRRDEALYDVPA